MAKSNLNNKNILSGNYCKSYKNGVIKDVTRYELPPIDYWSGQHTYFFEIN